MKTDTFTTWREPLNRELQERNETEGDIISRLIAAAPDLLEACKKLRDMEPWEELQDAGYHPDLINALADAVTAAIDKAEGTAISQTVCDLRDHAPGVHEESWRFDHLECP